MMKTALTAIGALALLTVCGCTTPPPNDVGITGMGGGVYYNPYVQDRSQQSVNREPAKATGTAAEGSVVARPGSNG